MGINGLLPVLKSITRPTHVKSYRGHKVAVDGYSWLHKGAYCCSTELCEGVYTDRRARPHGRARGRAHQCSLTGGGSSGRARACGACGVPL